MRISGMVLAGLLLASSVSGEARKRSGAGRDTVRAVAPAPRSQARSSISAAELREIPVDNLSDAVRRTAGVVVVGEELHFRCEHMQGIVQFDTTGRTAPGRRLQRPSATALPARENAQSVVIPPEAAAPRRLEIAARTKGRESTLAFDIGLPKPGALLELFDVMGRRVARCDLRALGAGRHVVRLDASPLMAGVYWARVSQGTAFETARLIRVP